jgi:hypothetical protein
MITVVLNCYKRPQYLKQQIEAIRNQTIDVDDIFIWYNKPDDAEQYDISGLGCKVSQCNHNFKFHGRFAFGLLAQTEYVAFFDDDTIPGKRWFENCLNTIQDGYDGILGTTGILLHSNKYNPHSKIGWNGRRVNDVTQVDLVGHAWFMKREHLIHMWREKPVSWENGEDMQLSYFAQKYGDVKTYVPPHPQDDLEMWGSLPDIGSNYGNDENASYKKNTHNNLRDSIVETLIKKGWVTLYGRT